MLLVPIQLAVTYVHAMRDSLVMDLYVKVNIMVFEFTLQSQMDQFLLLVGCTDGEVSLENGTSGILRICDNSIWRLVCDDEWDLDCATVVCNQLNYTVDDGELLTLSAHMHSESYGTWSVCLSVCLCVCMRSLL